MFVTRGLVSLAFLLLVVVPMFAEDPLPLAEGKWVLQYQVNATVEARLAILKLAKKDGKTVLELVDGGPRNLEVKDFRVQDGKVTASVQLGTNKLSFEGLIDPANPKVVRGSLGDASRVQLASLVPTDIEKLAANNMTIVKQLDGDLKEVQAIRSSLSQLRIQIGQSKDAGERQKLIAQFKEESSKADQKIFGLLKSFVEKQPDAPDSYSAYNELLARAAKEKVSSEVATKWSENLLKISAKYGPRIEADSRSKIGQALATDKALAGVAIKFLEPVTKDVAKLAPAARLNILKPYATALENAGKADLAKETIAKIEAIETVLDEEYLKKGLPFKPTKYEGRKDPKANQVAVMELFTGAQCPPCVAADVAFDALEKAYTSKDLILIQYHMHIPGPDPLTNLDSIARWDYYRAKFPMAIRGTPSTLFNGEPNAGGGGGMAQAESKFNQYKKLIDESLEQKTDVTLEGKASKKGNTVEVALKVSGMKDATDTVKVRLFLLEDTVRYVGGNGLRFHHHVVRSLFGKPEGYELKDLKSGELTAKLELDKVRSGLQKYLSEFAAQTPFPNPDRPLALKGLKVIALVQDDANCKILQAVQFDLGDK